MKGIYEQLNSVNKRFDAKSWHKWSSCTRYLSTLIAKNCEYTLKQAISLVGINIYEKLVKGYTEKQWGRPCNELPAATLKRLTVRLTYDNNYLETRVRVFP